MYQYQLRTSAQLLEALKALEQRKREIDTTYRIALDDIKADTAVIKSELDLLKALGKID